MFELFVCWLVAWQRFPLKIKKSKRCWAPGPALPPSKQWPVSSSNWFVNLPFGLSAYLCHPHIPASLPMLSETSSEVLNVSQMCTVPHVPFQNTFKWHSAWLKRGLHSLFYRGHGSNSQHPYGHWEPSVTPVPWDPMPSSDPQGHQACMWFIDTHTDKHSHTFFFSFWNSAQTLLNQLWEFENLSTAFPVTFLTLQL